MNNVAMPEEPNPSLSKTPRSALIIVLVLVFCAVQSSTAQGTNHGIGCDESYERCGGLVRKSTALGKQHLFDKTDTLKIKIATRKSIFRMDEMITFDLAILNTSLVPLYVLKPTNQTLEIEIFDEADQAVSTSTNSVDLVGYSVDMYDRITPGNFSQSQLNVLVGCEPQDKYTTRLVDALNEETLKARPQQGVALFEKGLFLSWGDRCGNFKRAGKYSISISLIESEFVLSSPKLKTKTMVARLRSRPFDFMIAN